MNENARIEAVTCCVGFTDYLAFTHLRNHRQFDHYLVVTSTADHLTQAYCRDHSITCVVTDVMFEGGKRFDRGAAVNVGFGQLLFNDWVVHLDVDIVLPDDFRARLRLPQLDVERMYGANRIIIESKREFYDFEAGRLPLDTFEYPKGCGYGYFQMFNCKSRVFNSLPDGSWYPSDHDRCESDWKFRNLWGEDYPDGPRGLFTHLSFPVIHCGAHGGRNRGDAWNTFFKPGHGRVRRPDGQYTEAFAHQPTSHVT